MACGNGPVLAADLSGDNAVVHNSIGSHVVSSLNLIPFGCSCFFISVLIIDDVFLSVRAFTKKNKKNNSRLLIGHYFEKSSRPPGFDGNICELLEKV